MNLYNNLLADFKKNFIMYVPLSIILQSCLGSVSIFYLTQLPYSTSVLIGVTMCTIVCMLYKRFHNGSAECEMGAQFFDFKCFCEYFDIACLLIYMTRI